MGNTTFPISKLSLDDVLQVVYSADDPTVVGYAAPIGSFLLRTNGEGYFKFGPLDTDWKLIGLAEDIQRVESTFAVLKEPTGYPNRTDSQVTFDDVTRTFTISPIGASFDYYIHGTKYTITGPKSIQIPDTQGLHYIYFDTNENLIVESGTPQLPDLLTDYAYSSALYWDVGSQTSIYVADERHGVILDGMTHIHFHLSLGTQYITGLEVTDLVVDGTGDLATEVQFGVTDGIIRDEDLQHSIVNGVRQTTQSTVPLEQVLAAPAQIPIMYREGINGDWKIKDSNDVYPLIYSGDSSGYVDATNQLPAWNEWTGATWQLSPVPANHYILMHYVATNDWRHPIIGLQGITEYQNKPRGLDAARIELNQMSGLPFQEWTPIATVIYECRDVFTNVPKARTRTTDDGANYVDWRNIETYTSTIGGTGTTDHGNLSGLADDDHPQYLNDARFALKNVEDLNNVVINPPLLDGQVLVYDSTATAFENLQIFVPGAKKTIQSVFGTVGAASGTTDILIDVVAPLITDGTQLWTETFTPTRADAEIKVTMSFAFAITNASSEVVTAIFRDNTCIGVMVDTASSSGGYQTVSFTIKDPGPFVPGTPVVYSARVGRNGGNATWYINTNAAGENFGGVLANNAYSIDEVVIL